MERFRILQEAKKLELDLDIDYSASQRAADAFERWGAETGGRSGSSASNSFINKFNDGTEVLIRTVAVAGDSLGAALVGGATVALAGLSSAAYAAAGGIGALIPLGAALGASLSSVVVGSQGVFSALGGINEVFAETAESSEELARQTKTLPMVLPSCLRAPDAFALTFALCARNSRKSVKRCRTSCSLGCPRNSRVQRDGAARRRQVA